MKSTKHKPLRLTFKQIKVKLTFEAVKQRANAMSKCTKKKKMFLRLKATDNH